MYDFREFAPHLEELRSRLMAILLVLFGTAAVALLDQKFYMKLVLIPHIQTMRTLNLANTIQVLHYEESFFAHLKVSLIAALIFTTPFAFHQIWLFISEGLYQDEKRYVYIFLPIMLLLFVCGVLFGYFVLVPTGLLFLASYNREMIHLGITLSSYISLFFVLTFVSGIIFELPLVMLILCKFGLVQTESYIENWRYSILVAFVCAAVLTPPDVVTQLLMAGPIITLYLTGILLCRFTERLQTIKAFLNH